MTARCEHATVGICAACWSRTRPNPTRATPSDAGCWIDGHRGHYVSSDLVEIALGLGMPDPTGEFTTAVEDYRRFGATGEVGSPAEHIFDMANEAEAWLNEHVSPEGYSFGWHDGEFFLWSDESWEGDNDNDGRRCSNCSLGIEFCRCPTTFGWPS